MLRILSSALVSLVALALAAGPAVAGWFDGADLLDGQTAMLPDERDAFGLAPAPGAPRLFEPLPLARLPLGSGVGLGFDVGQYRLIDPGTSISFDLRLSWPTVSSSDASDPGTLQPYVSMGPALFVADPVDILSLVGPRTDPTVAVGMKLGAGLTWHLDRYAALFGEYRVTRGSPELLGPLGSRSGGGVSGFDILYGLRLRF